jgi:DNA polymerase III epsilon subunit-like protein
MTREDRLWIMVDIETSGPVYGRHSMTELGAVVGSKSRGVVDRFEALLVPISDEAIVSQDSFEKARQQGVPPAEAMARFEQWTKPYREQGATFIARPAAFDWPWVVYYAWTFLKANPFGFKAACASSWFEAKGKRFDVALPHIAVQDAEIQLQHFLEHF